MATGKAIRAGRAFVELFADGTKLERGLKLAQAKLKTFAASTRATGQSLLATGTVAATPFALSARVLAGFEGRMSRVLALTNASEQEFNSLRDRAKELGKTTVFSASQAADAMSSFALAGFSVDQILASIGPTLDLAAAGKIEIGEAADIAAKLMAGMGIEADDLGNAVDVMAKVMTTSNTDLLMLGEAFKYVGPIAKTAGLSLEETTAAIQLLSNAGIQGEMAGTTLRGMLLSLTSPSAEAAAELKRLGVRVTDEAGNVRQFADIVSDLETSLAGAGTGDRLKSLGTIFPARQAAGAAELVAQGAFSLRDATGQLTSAAGTASRIAGTQLDNLEGDATILTSTLEGLAIAMGEAFGPELRVATKSVSLAVSSLANWVTGNKKVVLSIVGVTVAALAAGVALLGISVVSSLVATAIGAVIAVFSAFTAALGFILSPIGLVAVAFTTMAGSILSTSGILGDGLQWLGKRFEDLTAYASESFKLIGEAIAAGDIDKAVKVLWATIAMEWQRGINTLNIMWIGAKSFFIQKWTEASFAASNAMIRGFHATQAAWVETVSFISDLWEIAITGVAKSFNFVFREIEKYWVRLQSLFNGGFDVTAVITEIDAKYAKNSLSLDNQRDTAIGKSDRERRAALSQIQTDQRFNLDTLDKQRRDELERQQREFNRQLDESSDRLFQARQEWREAVKAAGEIKTAPLANADALAAIEKRLGESNQGVVKAQQVTGVNSALELGSAEASAAIANALSPEATVNKRIETILQRMERLMERREKQYRKRDTVTVERVQ